MCEDLSALPQSPAPNLEGGEDTSGVRGAVAHAHTFTFDYVYDQHATQSLVYETTARGIVDSSLAGYNATIFAYGQTGTGKTYTMEGFTLSDLQVGAGSGGSVEDRGIIPRAIEQIFGHIQQHASAQMRFLVRASYLQVRRPRHPPARPFPDYLTPPPPPPADLQRGHQRPAEAGEEQPGDQGGQKAGRVRGGAVGVGGEEPR